MNAYHLDINFYPELWHKEITRKYNIVPNNTQRYIVEYNLEEKTETLRTFQASRQNLQRKFLNRHKLG